jgi:DNA-binding response OmpR family regulator
MGMETEADDYVDKPVEPEVLVKRIETLLSK